MGVPLISVITINFNNKLGLENTIKNVVNQTFDDFEYIVIDGGSTDGSKEVIKVNAHKISYWISEPDKGIYNAMNKGLNVATGEYVIFMNSGDEFECETSISDAVRHFDGSDFILFDIKMIEENKPLRIKSHPKLLNFYYMFNSNIAHQSQFIKRSLFDKIGYYDENLKYLSDWKFNICALYKYYVSYNIVNEVLSKFMLDGVSSLPEFRNQLDAERDRVLRNEFSQYYEDYKKLNPTYYILAKRSNNLIVRKIQTLFSKVVILLSKY